MRERCLLDLLVGLDAAKRSGVGLNVAIGDAKLFRFIRSLRHANGSIHRNLLAAGQSCGQIQLVVTGLRLHVDSGQPIPGVFAGLYEDNVMFLPSSVQGSGRYVHLNFEEAGRARLDLSGTPGDVLECLTCLCKAQSQHKQRGE